MREQNHLPNIRSVRQDHHEAIDSHPKSPRRRHSVFEGSEKVLVNGMGLFVSFLLTPKLCFHPRSLVIRIVELTKGVANLHCADEGLESLHQSRVGQ